MWKHAETAAGAHLLLRLAQPEHDRRLRVESSARRRGDLGVREDAEGLRIVGALVAHERLQPLDRLDVVGENVEAGLGEHLDRLQVAGVVRD